jgi:hypothetical protein
MGWLLWRWKLVRRGPEKERVASGVFQPPFTASVRALRSVLAKDVGEDSGSVVDESMIG